MSETCANPGDRRLSRLECLYHRIKNVDPKTAFSIERAAGKTEVLTYAQFDTSVKNISRALLSALSVPAQRTFAAIVLNNTALFAAAFWGTLKCGLTPLLLPPHYGTERLLRLLADSGAAVVLTDAPGLSRFGGLSCPVLSAEALRGAQGARPYYTDWADEFAVVSLDRTGKDCVRVFDGNAVEKQLERLAAVKTTAPRVRVLLPFSHMLGLVPGLIRCSLLGKTLVFDRDTPDANGRIGTRGADCAEAILLTASELESAMKTFLPFSGGKRRLLTVSNLLQAVFPRAGAWLVRRFLFKRTRARAAYPSAVQLISTGGHVRRDTLLTCRGLGIEPIDLYGTQDTGPLSFKRPDRLVKNESAGLPLFGIKTRSDIDGRLFVKGEGFYETALAARDEQTSVYDDYVDTRDCCRFDKAGRLYPLGRADEALKDKTGETVYPHTLEAYYRDIEGVDAVCALGIPLGTGVEQIVLIVHFSEPADTPAGQAMRRRVFEMTDFVPGAFSPAALFGADCLPRSPLGCVNRPLVKKLLLDKNLKLEFLEKTEGPAPTEPARPSEINDIKPK
ncbi:MAG: acyl--CoA ligase [Clostridiales bacterium]|nr:acyl--CoA ligase [Clostridiales bacterium]